MWILVEVVVGVEPFSIYFFISHSLFRPLSHFRLLQPFRRLVYFTRATVLRSMLAGPERDSF